MKIQIAEALTTALPEINFVMDKGELVQKLQILAALLPQNTELGLFKRRYNPDPIIAIKIAGEWFALFECE